MFADARIRKVRCVQRALCALKLLYGCFFFFFSLSIQSHGQRRASVFKGAARGDERVLASGTLIAYARVQRMTRSLRAL